MKKQKNKTFHPESRIQHPESNIQNPESRIQKEGQAILFVLFILAVFGALAGGLAVMWESEIRTRTSDRDGLIAFYLAQAGIERATIELAKNESLAGGGPFALGGGTYNITIISVGCPPGPYGTCRQITSIGTVTSGGNILAERQISAGVSLDAPPPSPPNTAGDEDPLPWSWREI